MEVFAESPVSHHTKRTMLTIPDKVIIQLTDRNGQPIGQENVLVGIKTFATHKNNIDLSPFLSNTEGKIEITKKNIQDTADDFISYGLMDYVGLEYAHYNIEIYLWKDVQLDRYIDYWNNLLKNKKNRNNDNDPLLIAIKGQQRETMLQQFKDIAAREKETLDKFQSCCNKDLDTEHTDIIQDNWDGRLKEYSYKMKIKKKNGG